MNTCIVLGAGASLSNALHFRGTRMRDTRPPLDTTFFETVRARRIALSLPLRRYFRSILGVDPLSTALGDLRMEQVFADVFYDFGEAPDDRDVLRAYIDLVDLYLRVLRETTNWLAADSRRGAPIGRLLAAAAAGSESLTVITFNHDLVIENEIHRRAQLRARWCIDKCYGSLSSDLALLRPTGQGVPVFPLHEAGVCDHDAPITILKLHGSLNWVVRLQGQRPNANLLSGHTHPQMHLLMRRQLTGREVYVRHAGRGRQRWNFWPIVVPPVYAKQALRGAVQKAWVDARAIVESAERLVFFGYSLPQIDVEAQKLFERGLARNQSVEWIDVVNPGPEAAARFADIGANTPVRWYPSVDDLLERGDFR
jgi:hypothetical protein